MVRNISQSVLLSDEDTAWLLCFVWAGQMDGLQGEPGPAQQAWTRLVSSSALLNIIVHCIE